MPEHSLKDKTAKGLLWGGINNGAMQALNLVFGVITARILDDTDYGMVGMLSIFSLIAGSLQESGFTAALVNKTSVTKTTTPCSGFVQASASPFISFSSDARRLSPPSTVSPRWCRLPAIPSWDS